MEKMEIYGKVKWLEGALEYIGLAEDESIFKAIDEILEYVRNSEIKENESEKSPSYTVETTLLKGEQQ